MDTVTVYPSAVKSLVAHTNTQRHLPAAWFFRQHHRWQQYSCSGHRLHNITASTHAAAAAAATSMSRWRYCCRIFFAMAARPLPLCPHLVLDVDELEDGRLAAGQLLLTCRPKAQAD